MAGNINPRFTEVDIVGFGKVSAADTSTDATDADVVLVATASATDGSFFRYIKFQPRSTSGSTTTSAAVGRIYINNGSTVGTGTNNFLYEEITLPAISVNTAATSEAQCIICGLGFGLPPSYRIYVGVTAMAANTSWDVSVFGGDY